MIDDFILYTAPRSLERILEARRRVNRFLVRWALPLAILASLLAQALGKIDFGELGHGFALAGWRLVALAAVAGGRMSKNGQVVRFWTGLAAPGEHRPAGRGGEGSIQ